MKAYVPFFRLKRPIEKGVGYPPEKVGGYPFGLAGDRWPICPDCGEPMAFVCQYRHDETRLDLGAPELNLFVFNCDLGTCQSWLPESPAHACLLVPTSELRDELSAPPPGAREPYNEVWILGWVEIDEPGSEELAKAFLEISSHEKLPRDVRDGGYSSTKLGGFPTWIQMAETPGPEWAFVGQIGHYHHFFDPNMESAHWVTPMPDSSSVTHVGEGVMIGDLGIMYLFSRGHERKEIAMLWQC